MKDIGEHRVIIYLNGEEYKKLKYITEYLRKYTRSNETTPKIVVKLLSIIIEALDDKKIEARTALLSTIDEENKEKNIKAILEKFQNNKSNKATDIDDTKIIENLIFLSNVQKAIKKIEEDNAKTIKENEKTENKDKENENKKEVEIKTEKIEEAKTTKEEEQQPKPTQKEEKTETKVENKETENKQNEEEEEILRFPDL